MADDFRVEGNINPQNDTVKNSSQENGEKIIDEANYQIRGPREKAPSAVGRGGDTLYRNINATRQQLQELMEETQTVQDWLRREESNNAAIACLNNENLTEGYYQIKDGFDNYGKISLMGFKTPSGVEIPRLKVFDTNGDVIEVLTGPMAIAEITRRITAFRNSQYEQVPLEGNEPLTDSVIEDYKGSIG